jgi:uncharacterized membrane protein (UPF0182 family)
LAGALVWRGVTTGRRGLVALGAGVLLVEVLFFTLLSLWIELLWFEALGYPERFWTMVRVRVGAVAAGAVIGGGVFVLLTGRAPRPYRWATMLVAALAGGIWGLEAWDEILLYRNRVATGLVEPILGMDTGFYLFVLPLLDRLYWLALGAVVLALLASGLPFSTRQASPPLRLWTGASDNAFPTHRFYLAVAAAIATLWLVSLLAVPQFVQWLIVEPNEISFEKPYIAHNIEFTRRGFRLHDVEERQFPASEEFTRELLHKSRHLLSEVRLWDWRALDAVYKQFQEIRLYYEFSDVDMDRYRIGDRYRQVMISARELEQENLPAQSQTFVNQRFRVRPPGR